VIFIFVFLECVKLFAFLSVNYGCPSRSLYSRKVCLGFLIFIIVYYYILNLFLILT